MSTMCWKRWGRNIARTPQRRHRLLRLRQRSIVAIASKSIATASASSVFISSNNGDWFRRPTRTHQGSRGPANYLRSSSRLLNGGNQKRNQHGGIGRAPTGCQVPAWTSLIACDAIKAVISAGDVVEPFASQMINGRVQESQGLASHLIGNGDQSSPLRRTGAGAANGVPAAATARI